MTLMKILLLQDNENSILASFIEKELINFNYETESKRIDSYLLKLLNGDKGYVPSLFIPNFNSYDLTFFPSTAISLERISLEILREKCKEPLICYGAFSVAPLEPNESIDALLDLPTLVSYEKKARSEYVSSVIKEAMEKWKTHEQ